MKKAIIYVRTNFWGRWAIDDLLAQENGCRAYAESNDLKVIRTFRDKGSRRQRKIRLIPEALRYAMEHSGAIDILIVHSQQNLTRYKTDFSATLQAFKSVGLEVVFVTNKKYRQHEK